MRHSLAIVAFLVAMPLCGTAMAAPASAPHAAACVAALKARETDLAAALDNGASVGPQLLDVVRSGIAIIGTQYLAGLREAEARTMLDSAEKDFRALPPATAQGRQADCLQEGQALFKNAPSFERSLMTGAAQRRIKRLTKPAQGQPDQPR